MVKKIAPMCYDHWLLKLVYLADTVAKVNDLCLSFKGKDSNCF